MAANLEWRASRDTLDPHTIRSDAGMSAVGSNCAVVQPRVATTITRGALRRATPWAPWAGAGVGWVTCLIGRDDGDDHQHCTECREVPNHDRDAFHAKTIRRSARHRDTPIVRAWSWAALPIRVVLVKADDDS